MQRPRPDAKTLAELRRQFARGAFTTSHVPDELLLAALTDTIVRHQRRRTAVLCLPAAAGPVIVLSCGTNSLWTLLLLVPLAILLLGLGLWLEGDLAGRESLRHVRENLLTRPTPEMVPDLLRISHVLTAPTANPPYRAVGDINDALLPLLRDFRDIPRLEGVHRAALRRLVFRYERSRPELAVAALLVLADTGDRSLSVWARLWRRWHRFERMRLAAADYLAARKPT